ncbi:MAG: glucose-1-phosphate adenylyltransferase subunit GlgD [Ruminococcus sp.]|nr:glucose-1-phosphate adenylyltransferase subunit GlgD [Ruminococcus sp.]MDE6848352.1 glucose-1-phosphate adenylyltransferase subunit GlgD [Ruminococcus sp.]MDE7138763.1 glucose-1-phosphate adenylyltransferase subunit GlgD [Ruminococcus sp.]
MSVNYNVLGLIFASMHDSYVSELTKQRTMGSIPFGGRYRMIDFPLSNMVNSGIYEVGVITKSNYGSLLDHLGSGRDWDLSRKKGGLHLLPPYSQTGGMYKGRLDALNNIWSFVEHSKAKYVILANCDVVTTIDFTPVLKQHTDTGADITLIYSKGLYDSEKNNCATILEFNDENRLSDVLVDPQISGECNMWLDMMIMSKEFLKKIVSEAASRNQHSFTREILQGKRDEYKIMGYEHKEFFTRIDSVQNYYAANKMLLETEKRNALFKKTMPVYTKIGDNGPVKYGLESNIKNSLIADGCIIEGTVENSILFRGVKVGKGTVVKNSVILQSTKIGENCSISSVITDKCVEVSDDKVLTGSETYPLYIGKNGKI